MKLARFRERTLSLAAAGPEEAPDGNEGALPRGMGCYGKRDTCRC